MTVVPGGELLADDHVVVSHLPLTTPTRCSPSVYLGYLFVEPRRHVAELGDLTPEEAASMGRLANAAIGSPADRGRRAHLRGRHRPRGRAPACAPDPALSPHAA